MVVTDEAGNFTTLARAKVNLTLEILGRRPDGYHELRSLVAFADVADLVQMSVSAPHDGVAMHGNFAAALVGANIVDTAMALAHAAAPDLVRGRVTVAKNLPLAAGLGGGSADAAAVLRLLRAANPSFDSRIDWFAIAQRLGADVPICLASRTSVMRGTGERIAAVPGLPAIPAVLIYPHDAAPVDKTKAVFKALGAGPVVQRGDDSTIRLPSDLRPLLDVLVRQRNDLEAPARQLMPAVSEVFDRLAADKLAAVVRLSGAGPTVFALYEEPAAATAAAERLAGERPDWWVRAALIGDDAVRTPG